MLTNEQCDALLEKWGFECFMCSKLKRNYQRKQHGPIIEVYPSTEEFKIYYIPSGSFNVLSTGNASPITNKKHVMRLYKTIFREGKAIDKLYEEE